MIPEECSVDERKRAIWDNVICWRPAECDHKVILKTEWIDYAVAGCDLSGLVICTRCTKQDDKFLFVKEAALPLIKKSGVETADLRSWRDILGELVAGIIFRGDPTHLQ